MSRRSLATFLVIAAAFVAFGTVRFLDAQHQPADTPAVSHLSSAPVRISITDDARVSRGQDPMWVQLEAGAIPGEVTHLLVLTDQNCQPDGDGVSHCINQVRFETAAGTGEAVLRHHHRMTEEPCLTPGNVVELVRHQ